MAYIFAMWMFGAVISAGLQLWKRDRENNFMYEDTIAHNVAFRKYLFNSMLWPIALPIQIIRRIKQ